MTDKQQRTTTKRAARLRKIKLAVDALENALASKSNEAFRNLYYLERLAKKAR
jgi:hypothetical protein